MLFTMENGNLEREMASQNNIIQMAPFTKANSLTIKYINILTNETDIFIKKIYTK